MRSAVGVLLAALGAAGALHTGLVAPPRSVLTQPAAAPVPRHAPLPRRAHPPRRSSPKLRRSAPPVLFVDQADNLAGPLFGVSLFPYLAFLYFIRQPVNGLSDTAKSGFTFLLVFVFSTIITAIVSTKTFGLTLADVDWLHGDAEQLLTLTNVINVIGLKTTLDAYAAAPPGEAPKAPEAALPVTKICVGAAAAAIVGTFIASAGNVAEHTAYLGGFGNLPDGLWTYGFPEPANALSLPTWVIHVSSLLEWLVAMGLVWRIGIASGNPRWKGLTWAMIPSHSSGVCACVYHIFYNSPDLGFVVLLQAALTVVGNTTLAFAAWRLASSNGWVLPFGAGADGAPTTAAPRAEGAAQVSTDDNVALGLLTVLVWSVIASYVVKYGETLAPITLEAPAWAAAALIALPSAANVYKWKERSDAEGDFGGLI